MGLLATGNTFPKVPSKLTIASTANAAGTGKTARDGWCCAGFCSNGGITGGYRVHVGIETPTVQRLASRLTWVSCNLTPCSLK